MPGTFTARVVDGDVTSYGTCLAAAHIDAKGWQEVGGPILYGHDRAEPSIVARATRAWQEGDAMMIEGRFKEGDPIADFFWGKVLDGTLPAVSLCYERLEESPATAEELAARPELAGCTMIRRCRVIEVSLVVRGACPGAVILSIDGVPTGYAESSERKVG